MRRLMPAFLVMAMFSLSIIVPPLRAEQSSAKPAESVEIPLNPLPFVLKGSLRRSDGEDPFPAVIPLAACGYVAGSVDQVWGEALLSWALSR